MVGCADGDIVLVAPGTYGDDQGTHVSSLSGAGANFALSGDPAETDIHGTQRVYNGTLLLLK